MTLREYIRDDKWQNDEYNDFLLKSWELFELRVRAEDHYRENPHLAKRTKGALPLPWTKVKNVLEHGNGPPETIITRIAKRQYPIVVAIKESIRKVLARKREKTPIGKVQLVDSQCMRWMMLQPGRTPQEKAGSRQELLSVVRRENYDTLENRVLKLFLKEAKVSCKKYLDKYEKGYETHENIISVARFRKLCLQCLALPELEDVSEQKEIPQLNYVLRQDKLYSRIWKSWCDLKRFYDIAEMLWEHREEVNKQYDQCLASVDLHCSYKAKYYTPLWINEIKTNCHVFEEPIWENELGSEPIHKPTAPKSDTVIIDFTDPWDNRNKLCIPKNHPNARPFLDNPHQPSQEPCDVLELKDILQTRDEKALEDWLRAFYGVRGGKRWIVLTPDSWDAEWLEKVMQAMPIARDKVFLLWRSIAYALGRSYFDTFHEEEQLWISDRHPEDPYFDETQIIFKRDPESGRIIPQRASPRLHKERFRFRVEKVHLGCDQTESWLLEAGVEQFLNCEKEEHVAYFDELDGLFVLVQTQFEELKFEALVEPTECWPGGKEYRGKDVVVGFLQAGSKKLELRFAEGDNSDEAELKGATVEFEDKIEKDEDVKCRATLTPGQGVGELQFSANFLVKHLRFSLDKCKNTDDTKWRIEREMKRHFPPVMPLVQSSDALWQGVEYDVFKFLLSNKIPSNDLFARAELKYTGKDDPNFDATTMSPLELLRRVNVFGNDAGFERPDEDIDWHKLFAKLSRYYFRRGKSFLRLIAWTYQRHELAFETIRDELYIKYCELEKPLSTEEISFCANCYDSNDPRIGEILRQNIWRIKTKERFQEDLRLLYNLLQFYPQLIEVISTKDCNDVFYKLLCSYETISLKETKKLGYHLKCLLFLLHRRRYDKSFLQEYINANQDHPIGYNLDRPIPCTTDAKKVHEETRKCLLSYLVGKGTIEGIICSLKSD